MTFKEIFAFFFEGQSIDTIIYCCFIISAALALLVFIIYFFVHSWLSDDNDSSYTDSSDDDFWMALIFLDCLSRDIEAAYAEAEEEALKNDPDSLRYNIH